MANVGELFGRVWALQIGDRQWSDLRVTFEVQKTLNRHPNPGQITIYNLAKATRDSVRRSDVVRLVAGYEGIADVVYIGEVSEATSQRDGADWVTSLSCRDGDSAWLSNVRASYRSGANVATVVKSIAESMGLQVSPGSLSALSGLQTRGSLVQVGAAHRALQTLLEPAGYTWSVQDGTLQILPANGATTEAVVLLNPQTGLIGSPERQNDKGRATSKRVKVRATSLLQGAIRPGRIVRLQSEQISGDYRCNELMHKGDSHGAEWYTEMILQGV
jgi:hypothetical protein